MFVGPETFKVAGTSHYLGEILNLAVFNADYNMKKSELLEYYEDGDEIPQFTFPRNMAVNLVDEPENEYDPNAIRVELDGKKVGYIKKGSTGRVRNIQNEPDVKIKAEIVGGSFKKIYEDDDGKGRVESVKLDYGVKLTFYTSEYDISDGFRDGGVIKFDAPNEAPNGATEVKPQDGLSVGIQDGAAKDAKNSLAEKILKIALWVLAILFLLSGLGWLSSSLLTSVAYILAAVITVPIAVVQKFVHELNLKGLNKVICLLILIAIGGYFIPKDETDTSQKASAESRETIPADAEAAENNTETQDTEGSGEPSHNENESVPSTTNEDKLQIINRKIKAKFSGYADIQDMTINENPDAGQSGLYDVAIEATYTAITDNEHVKRGVNEYTQSLIDMVSTDCPSVLKISIRWELSALFHNRIHEYATKSYERVWDGDITYMVLTEESWPDAINK